MKFSQVELPSNRKFGFFFTAVFLIAAAFSYSTGNLFVFYMMNIIGMIFFIITIVNANILLPLNKLWMGFGFILGMIISPIVLGVIFFGLFTPIGILTRIFGRDELRLSYKKKLSYWVYRETGEYTQSFKNQY